MPVFRRKVGRTQAIALGGPRWHNRDCPGDAVEIQGEAVFFGRHGKFVATVVACPKCEKHSEFSAAELIELRRLELVAPELLERFRDRSGERIGDVVDDVPPTASAKPAATPWHRALAAMDQELTGSDVTTARLQVELMPPTPESALSPMHATFRLSNGLECSFVFGKMQLPAKLHRKRGESYASVEAVEQFIKAADSDKQAKMSYTHVLNAREMRWRW